MKLISVILIVNLASAKCSMENAVGCGRKALARWSVAFRFTSSICTLSSGRFSWNSGQIITKLYNRTRSVKLLRIKTGGGITNAHLYWLNGNTTGSTTQSGNYRHPLLNDWSQFKPAKIQVVLYDMSSVVLVSLEFFVPPAASMESWFNQNNLLTASPWNVAIMKGQNYRYFSIVGDGALKRQFYILNYYNFCPGNKGYLGVHHADESCSYISHAKGHPIVAYTSNGGLWDTTTNMADFFDIIGFYDEPIFNSEP